MASARRRSNSSLKADIFERPHMYDFFQAVRIIEAMAAEEAEAISQPLPDAVGRGTDPRKAAIRIRAAASLGFATAEVNSVNRPRDGGPIEITQSVIGLTGPSGVLPHAFSEMVQISVRERNPALREFFDIFNNRLAGLLYDGWAKYRIAVEQARFHLLETHRPIDMALRCLLGMGTTSLSGRNNTPDATFVFFGGLLSRQGRSATAIEHVMSGMLGHAVRVEQFYGEWLPIDPADRSRLPGTEFPHGVYCRLGEDSVVGERIFDVQSSIVLEVAPMEYAAFRALLPDSAQAKEFTDLAAIAVGPDKAFRVSLGLRPDEVPPLWLTRDPNDPNASRLGWNTWLNTSRPRETPVKVEFRPPSHLR